MTDTKKFFKDNIFFIVAISVLVLIVYDKYQSKHGSTHYKSTSKFSSDCKNNYKEVLIREVCDGDTISLTNCKNKAKDKKIRLIGIDAFETGQNDYAKQATRVLSNLVAKKKVCIELDVEEHDTYGRTLGYVFVNSDSDGEGSRSTFVNAELVKHGLALLSNVEPNTKYAQTLKLAQAYANRSKKGVWMDKDVLEETPSEFRARKRDE